MLKLKAFTLFKKATKDSNSLFFFFLKIESITLNQVPQSKII